MKMHSQWLLIAAAFLLTAASGIAQEASASASAAPQTPIGEHIVSRSELHEMAAEITVERQKNEEQNQGLLPTELASKALTRIHLNNTRIDKALSQLNEEDLNKLATQADQAASKVSGGKLSNRRLLFIVIALATAGMILIST